MRGVLGMINYHLPSSEHWQVRWWWWMIFFQIFNFQNSMIFILMIFSDSPSKAYSLGMRKSLKTSRLVEHSRQILGSATSMRQSKDNANYIIPPCDTSSCDVNREDFLIFLLSLRLCKESIFSLINTFIFANRFLFLLIKNLIFLLANLLILVNNCNVVARDLVT